MNLHDRPELYRITYRAGRWKVKSERYYSVHHSTEALVDLHYSFLKGSIPAKYITIFMIEEYNRFTEVWEDRTQVVINHTITNDLENTEIKKNKIRITEHTPS